MLKTIYLGKLSGIQLFIHWTFWLLVIFLGVRDLGHGVEAAARSVGFVFLVFFCVFLHELGHAFAGRLYNVKTLDITLYPIGGVARMQMRDLSPAAELVIAACGPLVNLVIALLLALTMALRVSWDGFDNVSNMGLMQQLLFVNIALFLFNLLPVYPMDGGRILRSILSFFIRREQAVEWTARLGQVLAALIALYGLFTFNLTLMIIFGIMFMACSAELFQARLRKAFAGQNQSGWPFPGSQNPFGGTSSPFGGSPFGGSPFGREAGPHSADHGWGNPNRDTGTSESFESRSNDVVDAEQVRQLK